MKLYSESDIMLCTVQSSVEDDLPFVVVNRAELYSTVLTLQHAKFLFIEY